MRKRIKLTMGALMLASTQGYAGSATFNNVEIKSLTYIAVAYGKHQAGNFELALVTPFDSTEVVCDGQYVTTLQATDPDGRMYALLLAAHMAGKKVQINVTDSAAYTAYEGRCSLQWANVGE